MSETKQRRKTIRMSRGWVSYTTNAVIVGCAVVVSLGAAELCIRWVKPQPTYSNLLEQVGSYYSPSDTNTWELKKNYRGTEPSMENLGSRVSVSINSDGFRGPELEPNKKKVLMIGDSYTFGVYVNDNETYPFVLGRLLAKDFKNYQVTNAGFAAGLETDQQYVWTKHNIKKLKPDVVVLGVFLANDISGIKTSAWQDIDANGLPTKWLDSEFKVSESGVIKSTSSDQAKSVLQFLYKNEFLRESHLAIAIGRVSDRIFSFKKIDYVDAYKFIYGQYDAEFLEKETIFLRMIEAIRDEVVAEHSKFMVVMLPINFMIEPEKMDKFFPNTQKLKGLNSTYYNRLERMLDSKGIRYLNIEKSMKSNPGGPYFPENGEPHFNSNGHSFTAEQLYNFLLENEMVVK